MKRKRHFRAAPALSIGLGLILSGRAIGQGQGQQPPEHKEIVAASRLMDAAARARALYVKINRKAEGFEAQKVVFFAQEKDSKKVLNAVVIDVK